ncbi:hypothetical protein A5695_13230 [Mycobacterium sp. E1747]|nr:hypothetical protein A5695_13230 [Mycobacterium sp. E1747]
MERCRQALELVVPLVNGGEVIAFHRLAALAKSLTDLGFQFCGDGMKLRDTRPAIFRIEIEVARHTTGLVTVRLETVFAASCVDDCVGVRMVI